MGSLDAEDNSSSIAICIADINDVLNSEVYPKREKKQKARCGRLIFKMAGFPLIGIGFSQRIRVLRYRISILPLSQNDSTISVFDVD